MFFEQQIFHKNLPYFDGDRAFSKINTGHFHKRSVMKSGAGVVVAIVANAFEKPKEIEK